MMEETKLYPTILKSHILFNVDNFLYLKKKELFSLLKEEEIDVQVPKIPYG